MTTLAVCGKRKEYDGTLVPLQMPKKPALLCRSGDESEIPFFDLNGPYPDQMDVESPRSLSGPSAPIRDKIASESPTRTDSIPSESDSDDEFGEPSLHSCSIHSTSSVFDQVFGNEASQAAVADELRPQSVEECYGK